MLKFYSNKTSRNGRHLRFFSSSVPVDGNVSDVDNDSDDADGDLIDNNDYLVSVATPDAAPADSNDDKSSATEDHSSVDSDQDDDGEGGEKLSSTTAPKAFDG